MNRSLLLLISFILTYGALNAQIGFSGSFTDLNVNNWQAASGDASYAPAYSLGVNYWAGLSNVRIEFHPEVRFTHGKEVEFFQVPGLTNDYVYFKDQLNVLIFKGETRFYLFDFYDDCDCPTFTDQGNLLKKGFFLAISPSAGQLYKNRSLGRSDSETVPDMLEKSTEESFIFGLGIGAGVDIGFSDAFILTPFVHYEVYSKVSWTFAVCDNCSLEPVDDNPQILSIGLNFSFNWRK